MSRARIERGGFVYPLQDDVGDPEDAEGWRDDGGDEHEALFRRPTFAPEPLDGEHADGMDAEDPAGDEHDEAWSGRIVRA